MSKPAYPKYKSVMFVHNVMTNNKIGKTFLSEIYFLTFKTVTEVNVILVFDGFFFFTLNIVYVIVY